MVTEKERLELILQLCCGNKKTNFAKRLNMTQQGGQAWFSNGTYDVKKLSAAFPELSNEWLLRGTGPMFDADIESEHQRALDTLGITEEQWHSITGNQQNNAPEQTAPVPSGSAAGGNKECTRPYDSIQPTTYQVAEGEAVDRALLNLLLREKSVLESRIATLESRNLELEKQNARLEERFAGATAWYHLAITAHPDLKK